MNSEKYSIDESVLEKMAKLSEAYTELESRLIGCSQGAKKELVGAINVLQENKEPDVSIVGCQIGDAGVVRIARALRRNTSVTTLRLCEVGMSDKGVSALAAAVAEHPSLQELYIDDNVFLYEGMHAVAQLVASNSNMKTLSLTKNKVDHTGMAALCAALTHNTTLEDVRLCHNILGDAGLVVLAQTLAERNTTLRKVTMWDNQFTDSGAETLTQFLGSSSSLTDISFGGNPLISAEATARLAAAACTSRFVSDPHHPLTFRRASAATTCKLPGSASPPQSHSYLRLAVGVALCGTLVGAVLLWRRKQAIQAHS